VHVRPVGRKERGKRVDAHGRRRTKIRRSLRALLLLPILVIAAGAATYSAPAPAAGPSSKVAQKVVDQVSANGKATFWVILKEKADLSKVSKIGNWNERGRLVVDELKQTADESQAGLRGFLKKAGAQYEPFWIMNAIKVTAGQGVLNNLAHDPTIAAILPDRSYEVPKPIAGSQEPKVNTVEWNVNDIGAPNVWSTFGDRGENIVVANIDTGVQFDHPAVVGAYRGNLHNGSFDHNYNWFDPENVCGTPAPCDNVAHGTHTMGTMVGDDRGGNQIGVAPGAKWIAAKGCETNSCSLDALLRSGQWVMAPTDLSGNNPRPDLRPNIVNNSWGDGPTDPFYEATVQAWLASGIFPAFANGNAGPSCNTAGVPGAYPESYAVGAFDINHNIASFSSRGPSGVDGSIKPDISGPGVNVRSSVPGNGYDVFSGTSMATPHLAATVALMWSAAPSLIGQIGATETLLDSTADDMSDLSCGGTAGNNNVWGEGRLNAFNAVEQSPRGPTGTLQGTVSGGGGPIAGATVQATGPTNRTVTTDANGQYSAVLPIDSYSVSASAFGFVTQTVNASVSEGQTTTQDFNLAQAPSHSVAGHVSAGGNPVGNGTLTILNTPLAPATTDGSGAYSFASVPDGEYDVMAAGGKCFDPQTRHLSLSANVSNFDFNLTRRHDSFGYFCDVQAPNYVEGDTALGLSGDDNNVPVTLPFAFTFYGQTFTTAWACSNGFLTFQDPGGPGCPFFNSAVPSTDPPNAAIYPFWDDLVLDGSSSSWTKVVGSAPDRQFVIEWRNATFFPPGGPKRIDSEVILTENGQILTEYRNVDADSQEQGASATIGIESPDGTDGLQYSFNEATIDSPAFAVLYKLPPSGFIQGHVSDFNDNLPLPGAAVKVTQGGSTIRQLTTDAAGFYRTQVPVGDYNVEVSSANYQSQTKPAHLVNDGDTTTIDFALKTARAEVTPNTLEVIAPPGQTRTRILALKNTGSVDMTWQIKETGGGAQAAIAPGAKTPGFDANARSTKGLYVNGTPAGWSPQSPGQVIRQWPTAPLSLAWGVGYTGNVWLSDVPSNNNNHEFTPLGVPTGRMWHAGWAGAWPGDMALDTTHGSMCQVNVGGDNGIYCWDPASGTVTGSITSGPWTQISQRGLAYDASDDTFFIGGWNEGILYKVKGLGYPDKGAVVSQCNPPDGNISGLAWNPAFNVVWEATNTPSDTIYELNPDTCQVLSTLAHPNPGFNGAGLEEDEAGNLWMISQNAHNAYLVDSGVPAFQDVPWISESPDHGTLAPGGTQNVTLTINTAGLSPGVYNATLFFQSNSGRNPSLRVPVRLIVPAYEQGVNAGSGPAYVDKLGDTWSADKAYASGSWGYMQRVNTASTKSAIGGTTDPAPYQTARRGQTEYRFDGLPTGTYQVNLKFAEIQNYKTGQRLFDVIIENSLVLPALDVSGEVGKNHADDKTFYIAVTDGQLNVRFIQRQSTKEPIINAIQVIQRPDR
jgi:subtilisin family serine protease